MTLRLFTILRADAMYFDAAVRALESAKESISGIDAARSTVDRTLESMEQVEAEPGIKANHAEFERLAIAMESYEAGLSAAYGPFLQSLASVHLLSAASIEAYINDRGRDRLSGREWDAFEKCPLEAKWIFFTRVFARGGGFACGVEPMQGLARLVKRRNDLVHLKPRREEWSRGPGSIPPCVERLGLTEAFAQDSVDTARRLITDLSTVIDGRPPAWLNIEGQLGYFDFSTGGEGTVLTTPDVPEE